jgi:RNA polymerase sigma-70 factor (ECF subfamily)
MGFADLSDEELIGEIRSRSGAARDAVVNELFGRHYERVGRWCFRFANDREAAADLVQEVFLKAHRHLDSFKGTSRFTTWLYTIVRNESLNRLQRSGPATEADDVLENLAAIEPGPEELAERRSVAERLRDFLTETLDQVERTVFTLHYGEDMPLDAITRLLRLQNASGAKAYIVSAKRKLARAARQLRATGEEL